VTYLDFGPIGQESGFEGHAAEGKSTSDSKDFPHRLISEPLILSSIGLEHLMLGPRMKNERHEVSRWEAEIGLANGTERDSGSDTKLGG